MRPSHDIDGSFFPVFRLNLLLQELGYREIGDFIHYTKIDQRSRPELPYRLTLSHMPSLAVDGTHWLPKRVIPDLLRQLAGAGPRDKETLDAIRSLFDWKIA